MPVTRTYVCDDCQYEFSQFHMNRDEPAPECPACYAATHSIPGRFNITSARSKAVDLTQKIAEEDFGLTNIRDNSRAGDIAALPPSQVQTAEAEMLTRQMKEAAPQMDEQKAELVNAFWKNSMSGATPPGAGTPGMTREQERDALLAQGQIASAQATGLGADPVGLLHEAGKRGMAETHLEVLNPKSTRSLST